MMKTFDREYLLELADEFDEMEATHRRSTKTSSEIRAVIAAHDKAVRERDSLAKRCDKYFENRQSLLLAFDYLLRMVTRDRA